MAQAFEYTPLPRPNEQIRLLQLFQTNSSDDVIMCRLDTFDVSDCPPYVAISYQWGKPDLSKYLVINGSLAKVHYNCWVALWQMRYHHLQQFLWIDYLCIDQSSNLEKAVQVRKMGQIFKHATFITSSLGEGVDFARHAQELRQRGQLQGEQNMESSSISRPLNLLPGRATGTVKANENFLSQLARTAYFDRIVQELLAGPNIRLFCGRDMLEWSQLTETLESRDQALKLGDTTRVEAIIKDRDLRLSTPVVSLDADAASLRKFFQHLVRYGSGLCKDPRDKIYGLLALVWSNGLNAQRLPIDYDKPLFDVLLDFISLIDECARNDEEGFHISHVAHVIDRLLYWFEIRYKDREAQGFLDSRWMAIRAARESSSPDPNRSLKLSGGIQCAVIETRRICEDPCFGLVLEASAGILREFWSKMQLPDLDPNRPGGEDFVLIRAGQRLAFLASPGVKAGDVLVKIDVSKLGKPTLIARTTGTDREAHAIVGRAIQLDPSSEVWLNSCTCGVNTAASVEVVHLRSFDILALALLRQRVTESLSGPVLS